MPVNRCLLWLGLAALAVLSLAEMRQASLAARVPHCAAQDVRELLVAVAEAEPREVFETEAGAPTPRLRLRAEVLEDGDSACPLVGRHLRLNWYFPPEVRAGELWRVAARVRPPWGYRNPGGFDYERWLMGEGIDGTGYIRTGGRQAAAQPDVRRQIRALIAERTAAHSNSAHLRALASADSVALTDADWALLRRTATVHLLVVSGLHVGLVAVLGYFLGVGVARLLPWLLVWTPAGWVGAACSLVAVSGFVWLCGSEAPALRAGVMGTLGILALAGGRRVPAGCWLALAALAVLTLSPHSLLTQGFWLSFGAVTVLITGFARLTPRPGWLGGLVRAQLLMLFAMTPMTAALVGEVAPLAGLSNLFAVPWISLVTVPLVVCSLVMALLGLPLDQLGWTLADWSLTVLLAGLQALGRNAPYLTPIEPWQAAVSLAAFACALAASHWRARLACLPLWAAALLVPHERPSWGEYLVQALDVGQGSAILVDTHRHRLLYDAGMKFPTGFDLGEAVVLPALAATGPRRLDRLIVSHGDLDHAGGAPAVLAGVPTASLLGAPQLGGRPCVRGERWLWDGVTFEILHPPRDYSVQGNDSSCVLQISAGVERTLLTGDVTRRAEGQMLSQETPPPQCRDQRGRLPSCAGLAPARLLFAPHHGSNTSSSRRFIEAVNPSLVFVSAGWGNRYGHPHPAVLRRYRQLGSKVWVTGTHGALSWSSARPEQVRAYRWQRRGGWAWWINQPPEGG